MCVHLTCSPNHLIFDARISTPAESNEIEKDPIDMERARTSSPPVLEWRIENFGCWMKSAHGVSISCCERSEILPGAVTLSLYPRGEDGDGKWLIVSICYAASNVIFREVYGDVLFIGPDGSTFHSEVIAGTNNRVIGPRFKDVVSRIEKNEDLHGDHLIIRYQYVERAETRICMKTTLAVQDTSLLITRPNPSHNASKVTIASIPYHNSRNIEERMLVVYDTVRMCLYLKRTAENVSISVRVLVRYDLMAYDRSIGRATRRKNEIDFHERCFQRVFDPKSCLEGGGCYILRLKIINGNYESTTCSSRCEYFFASTSPVDNAPKIAVEKSDDSLSLSEDLRLLYQGGEFSDLQLKCGDVSFPIHRAILCARSPVFKTMLSTDMKESASRSVDIEDLDPSTLRLFLTFLYTDSFKEVSCERALKLYSAAINYKVPALKKKCVDLLCDNVCVANVCDVLSLGTRHMDKQLIYAAQDYIACNFEDVLGSKDWKDHWETDSHLLLQTLSDLAIQKKVVPVINEM